MIFTTKLESEKLIVNTCPVLCTNLHRPFLASRMCHFKITFSLKFLNKRYTDLLWQLLFTSSSRDKQTKLLNLLHFYNGLMATTMHDRSSSVEDFLRNHRSRLNEDKIRMKNKEPSGYVNRWYK